MKCYLILSTGRGRRLVFIGCFGLGLPAWGVCAQPPAEVSTSCGAPALPGSLSVLVPSSSDLKRVGGQEHRPSCCWLLPAVCFLDPGHDLAGRPRVHACQRVTTEGGLEENPHCGQGRLMVPRGPKMTAWPFGSQTSVVRWSCVPTVVWMESWVGRLSPTAPELASDKRVRSGMWSGCHVLLAGFTSGLMKTDVVTSAVLGNARSWVQMLGES